MKSLINILKNTEGYKRTVFNCEKTFCSNVSNPTLFIEDNDTIFLNFRCTDYLAYVSRNKKYTKQINGWISNDPISSNNYLGYIENEQFSNNIKKLNVPHYKNARYNGLEDAIFIEWDNTKYLCGTRCDIDEAGRFCIYELDNYYNVVDETIINDEKYVSKLEKHWSPVEGMPFTFIRWSNPTEIITIDKNTGNVVNRIVKQESDLCKTEIRGNCQTVKYKEGYLSIVHNNKFNITKASEFIPSYKHMFIQYDNDFNIVKISQPFAFEFDDIEFCCGLQIRNKKVYISYSIFDSIPVLIEFDEKCIDDIFNRIENTPETTINNLYEIGCDFLKKEQFCSAASCFSRIFSDTDNKELEYNSLMRFCICLLAVKYGGINLFSDDNILSFLDDLMLLKNDKAEPLYLYSIYHGLIGDLKKKEIFRKQSTKYRFELPEIKRYLKMW